MTNNVLYHITLSEGVLSMTSSHKLGERLFFVVLAWRSTKHFFISRSHKPPYGRPFLRKKHFSYLAQRHKLWTVSLSIFSMAIIFHHVYGRKVLMAAGRAHRIDYNIEMSTAVGTSVGTAFPGRDTIVIKIRLLMYIVRG